MGLAELIEFSTRYPRLFLQLDYDAALAASDGEGGDGRPGWRRPGETAAQARDRLRAGREEAKRRTGVG